MYWRCRPTFYQIYKKKSAEGYQSIPYVVALFSSMLWIYYALLKSNATLLITINSFGCVVETIYIGFYIYYASKKARVQTIKMLVLLVIVGFGAVALVSQFLFKGAIVRAQVVGWRQVIRTKSVEHMPILLSVFLTVSAVMWFFYGLLLKDINIAVPNVLGFIFGILQMVLYAMYKGKKQQPDDEKQLPQVVIPTVVALEEKQKLPKELTEEQIVDIVKLGSLICSDKINAQTSLVLALVAWLWHEDGMSGLSHEGGMALGKVQLGIGGLSHKTMDSRENADFVWRNWLSCGQTRACVKVRCGRIGTMESKDGASLGRLSLGLGGLRVGVGHVR
nr:bidirectional sugar transporter SWEET12-like [Ipomoea batatas]GME08334.1 bidirectional sugar transporter SWEET12-like [Ipomoea batatas]